MIKPIFKLDQLEKMIQKLPLKQRTQLLERFQRDHTKKQFEKMFASIDARVKDHPISEQEIIQLVKEVRREMSAQN